MSNVEDIDEKDIFEPRAEIAYDLSYSGDRNALMNMATDILVALLKTNDNLHHPLKSAEPVSIDGTTRTGGKFMEWNSKRIFVENCEFEPRLHYPDDSFIDIVSSPDGMYVVTLGETDESFPIIRDAEVCLWNNHSRHHYDAGEVR